MTKWNVVNEGKELLTTEGISGWLFSHCIDATQNEVSKTLPNAIFLVILRWPGPVMKVLVLNRFQSGVLRIIGCSLPNICD